MLCCVAYCLLYVYTYKLYNLWLWTFFLFIGRWSLGSSMMMKRVDDAFTGHWSDERVIFEYYGYSIKEKERSCKELDPKSFL